ncbi:magnesium and cobalt transport protein CorA [Mycetocola tolaasinivorans]|uniref:Magnesium and cobalt transport protein CorA n=1 Tax=Mycetocola tolaasinivorans TaxID=76635 RepID=A0A3L7A7Q1_9MICO|nr:magnesium and cobalt transport protein CorA [Mycetocola tolaasinivorans]RLP75382.1 magnesium and cobalt transport protein CorA [Mycetocola tolaasinivorans]
MVMIDNAVYVAGRRVASPAGIEQTLPVLAEYPDGFAWVGLYRPDETELRQLATDFDIHELIVEDSSQGHQRPKYERYGETTLTVLRSAHYVDAEERVDFGEVHVITGPRTAVVIRHSEAPNFAETRRGLEADPTRLAEGPEAVLFAVLDEIVDGYEPVMAGLENDVDEIEDALFAEGHEQSQRIYQLSREVIAFQRAVTPLPAMLAAIAARMPATALEQRRRLRDVGDHAVRVIERAAGYRSLLENALTVNTALVGQRQNDETRILTEASLRQSEEMKKISSWAAIIFAPSLIGSVYGMNFHNMPELSWEWGYPFSIGLMAAFAGALYWIFKKKHWL